MSTSKGGSPRKSQERKDFEAHASAIGGLVASRIRTMKTTDLGMKLASSASKNGWNDAKDQAYQKRILLFLGYASRENNVSLMKNVVNIRS